MVIKFQIIRLVCPPVRLALPSGIRLLFHRQRHPSTPPRPDALSPSRCRQNNVRFPLSMIIPLLCVRLFSFIRVFSYVSFKAVSSDSQIRSFPPTPLPLSTSFLPLHFSSHTLSLSPLAPSPPGSVLRRKGAIILQLQYRRHPYVQLFLRLYRHMLLLMCLFVPLHLHTLN